MTALLRTFRRARIAIPFSRGFHPKPRIAFGPACPVGTESQAEYLDAELYGVQEPAHVAAHLRRELPDGFRLLSCDRLEPGAPALSRTIRGIEYFVELPDGAPAAAERIAAFERLPAASVVRERDGKPPQLIDLKIAFEAIRAVGARELRFTLRAGEVDATARPAELLAHLFGAEWVRPGVARLVRESVVFGNPA